MKCLEKKTKKQEMCANSVLNAAPISEGAIGRERLVPQKVNLRERSSFILIFKYGSASQTLNTDTLRVKSAPVEKLQTLKPFHSISMSKATGDSLAATLIYRRTSGRAGATHRFTCQDNTAIKVPFIILGKH